MEREVADRILAGLKKHRDGGGSSSESDGDGERKLYKQTRCGGVIEEVGDDWAYQSESIGVSLLVARLLRQRTDILRHSLNSSKRSYRI